MLVTNNCSKYHCISSEPCPEGRYQDEAWFIPPGSERLCLPCRTCAAGSGLKVKAPCSRTSNTVCEPDEGHFCWWAPGGRSCVVSQRHRRCLPGEYIRKPGGPFADTECGTCANGSFSDGTLSLCQPHTQCEQLDKVTVAAGTSESDTDIGLNDALDVFTGVQHRLTSEDPSSAGKVDPTSVSNPISIGLNDALDVFTGVQHRLTSEDPSSAGKVDPTSVSNPISIGLNDALDVFTGVQHRLTSEDPSSVGKVDPTSVSNPIRCEQLDKVTVAAGTSESDTDIGLNDALDVFTGVQHRLTSEDPSSAGKVDPTSVSNPIRSFLCL
uniref:TNFR-Cys domain-containing protein n=2 Tax=Knipowitschia caucasica TaxID=637954 RepID=A0AAV2M1Z6_KNICA